MMPVGRPPTPPSRNCALTALLPNAWSQAVGSLVAGVRLTVPDVGGTQQTEQTCGRDRDGFVQRPDFHLGVDRHRDVRLHDDFRQAHGAEPRERKGERVGPGPRAWSAMPPARCCPA